MLCRIPWSAKCRNHHDSRSLSHHEFTWAFRCSGESIQGRRYAGDILLWPVQQSQTGWHRHYRSTSRSAPGNVERCPTGEKRTLFGRGWSRDHGIGHDRNRVVPHGVYPMAGWPGKGDWCPQNQLACGHGRPESAHMVYWQAAPCRPLRAGFPLYPWFGPERFRSETDRGRGCFCYQHARYRSTDGNGLSCSSSAYGCKCQGRFRHRYCV